MVVGRPQGAQMEEQFVQQMKLLRETQRISQGDLASRMVSAGWEYWRQTTVSRVEKFERTVRLAEAHDIAKILGLSLAGMLSLNEEVQGQNIDAAKRRRDLDDMVGRLNESTAAFMAQLEQFRTTLHHQTSSRQEELGAPVAAKTAAAPVPDQDNEARKTIQQLERAAKDLLGESARLEHDGNDDSRRAEAHSGIDPEA